MAARTEVEAIFRLKDEMTARLRTVDKQLGKIEKSAKDNKKALEKISKGVSFANLTKSIISAHAAMALFRKGMQAVTREFSASIEASSRAIEVQNLFEVSFGNMAAAAEDWAQRTHKAIGVNDTTLKEMSGTLYNMVTAMGISRDSAYDMATGFTELALDASSFFNLPFAVTFQKIRAGLSGETEPLKQLGVLVTVNAMQQLDWVKAIKAAGGALTEQQKVVARAQLIQKGLANSQGDLVRTQDSWANATRLVGEAWTDLREELGVAVTDNRTAGVVITTVTEAVKELTKALKENQVGFTELVTKGILIAVGALREWANALAKVGALGDILAKAVGGKGSPELTKALEETVKGLDSLHASITNAAAAQLAAQSPASRYLALTEAQKVMYEALRDAGWEAAKAIDRVMLGAKTAAGGMGNLTTATVLTKTGIKELNAQKAEMLRMDRPLNLSIMALADSFMAETTQIYEMNAAIHEYGTRVKSSIAFTNTYAHTVGEGAREMTNMAGSGREATEAMIAVGVAMSGATGDIGKVSLAVINLSESMAAGAVTMGGYAGVAIAAGTAIFNLVEGTGGLLDLNATLREMQEEMARAGDFTEELKEELGEALNTLGGYFEYLAESSSLSTDDTSAGVGVMVAAFNQALAAAGNLVDAFDMLGEGFTDLLDRLKGTGVAAVDTMAALYAFVEENEGPLGALADLISAVQMLGESGILTAADLAALGNAAEVEFQKLIDSGADLPTILAAIGPQLAALYQQYKAMGLDIPPWLSAIEEHLEGIEPPRSTEDIMKSIEAAVWALAEAFGVANDNATSLSSTLTGMPVPPSNAPPSPNSYRGAAAGMFERLKRDTMILAHAGELVNIIPKAMSNQMAIRTAQTGIPEYAGHRVAEYAGPPNRTDAGYGGGPVLPSEVVAAVAGVGSMAVAQALGRAIGAASPQAISISAPTEIRVDVPELSERQWADKYSDEILPRLERSLINREGRIANIVADIARRA